MSEKNKNYKVNVAPAAERAIKKLSGSVRKRIFKSLVSLEQEPRPHGVKKLSGIKNLYRIRIGDYRVVYQVQDNILVVLVVKIGHRRDVYK